MSNINLVARRITEAPSFDAGIVAIIILNAVLLGFGTSPEISQSYGALIDIGHYVTLVIFIVEAILKMIAASPRVAGYFRDGWNVFDFLVIVFALIPATGQYAIIARLVRLLRVLRLVSTIRDLRLIVTALVRSIPSVGHVMLLMSIVVYIYSIIGYHLFSDHDPQNWRDLGKSLLTLFNIITLEGWTDIMFNAMELNEFAWIYFVSFVVIGTFVVFNLFIAIIINNLDEAKLERLRDLESPPSREELLRELRATQDALNRLERRIKDE
ncbi:MAG: ion transporter [Chloroflexi bacterium]|nr:ion transporter [Chloroflexota bacterium]